MEIVYTYSPIWLLLIFTIAALLSFWLYKGDKILGGKSPWLIRALGLFRFISLSLIAFFLLEPLIKSEEREVQQPIVAIAIDNSESILNGKDSLFYKDQLALSINEMVSTLEGSYDVEVFSFDEHVKSGTSYDYSGKITDLSNLINEFETRYYNRNLGAIIVASDGNYNQGINPNYLPASLNAPIYGVLLGDTGKVNDLAIKEVISNSISFFGDEFPVEINLNAEGMDDKNYSLQIFNNGKVVFEEKGTIEGENWFKSLPILLNAENVGVQKYTLLLKGDAEEAVLQNNKAVFYIDILDERLKIAIVSATAHPDVATWKNALKKNKNYEVHVYDADKFDEKVNDFSLFILYQVPTKSSHIDLISRIKDAKIPILYHIGLKTNINEFNRSSKGEYTLTIEADVEENFKATFNKDFSLYSVNKRIIDIQDNLPPLTAPLLVVSSNNVYQKLMTKKIGQLDTQIPFWILSESSIPKSTVIIGEGLWRWNIHAYKEFESHDEFDNFLQQNVKYLIRKSSNKRFEINVDKEFFEGSRVKMNAQVLNPSMESANGADIELTLINSDKEKFNYAFTESTSTYNLDLGALESGDYSYTAKAKLNEEIFVQKGKFTIKKRMLEQKDTRANAALMYQWAEKTGGKLFYPNQIDEISKLVLQSNLASISYQTERYTELIRLSWLLFVISLFLSIEWFLRRYFGSY